MYEDAAADVADDTGPAPTADTLDDRFASAGAVAAPPDPVPAPWGPDGSPGPPGEPTTEAAGPVLPRQDGSAGPSWGPAAEAAGAVVPRQDGSAPPPTGATTEGTGPAVPLQDGSAGPSWGPAAEAAEPVVPRQDGSAPPPTGATTEGTGPVVPLQDGSAGPSWGPAADAAGAVLPRQDGPARPSWEPTADANRPPAPLQGESAGPGTRRPDEATAPGAGRPDRPGMTEGPRPGGSAGPDAPRPGGPGSPEPVELRASLPEPSGAEPRAFLPPEPEPERERAAGLSVAYVGDGPPTYDAEPTALPAADPDELEDLVADTVLDGARYGSCTLRAASVRGDSARYRGEPRRDSLLTARFGSGPGALILVAMATGARATPGAHRAAAEACDWIGRAVGLSHARLAEDIRAGRRGDLKSGLHRLTDRSLGKLRAGAAEQGLGPEEYAAGLRCLLVPADPACRTRVFFGVGDGGLFRLRGGEWQDIEPGVAEQSGAPVVGYGSLPPAETTDGDRLTMDLGITTPPSPYEPAPEPPRDPFRFRASVARPGDTLLLCTAGLAEPLRGEPGLGRHLARRWEANEAPGLAAFLADTQVRVKGYADDRTAAAVWEA
ncbi:protein phosphatase 2C domain-containing protein [Streptomyces kunmingensis]